MTVRPESDTLYEVIVILRRHGHAVYRAGADHLVDGKRLSADQLLHLRTACGLLEAMQK